MTNFEQMSGLRRCFIYLSKAIELFELTKLMTDKDIAFIEKVCQIMEEDGHV